MVVATWVYRRPARLRRGPGTRYRAQQPFQAPLPDVEATLGLIGVEAGPHVMTADAPVEVDLGLIEVDLGPEPLTTDSPVVAALGLIEVEVGPHAMAAGPLTDVSATLSLIEVEADQFPIRVSSSVFADLALMEVELGLHSLEAQSGIAIIGVPVGVQPIDVVLGDSVLAQLRQNKVPLRPLPITTRVGSTDVNASLGLIRVAIGMHDLTTDNSTPLAYLGLIGVPLLALPMSVSTTTRRPGSEVYLLVGMPTAAQYGRSV